MTGPGWTVGLDVGGSKTHAVLLDDEGRVRDQVRRVTGRGGEAVVATVVDAVRTLVAGLPGTGDGPGGGTGDGPGDRAPRVAGVGIGVPGLVGPGGTIAHAVNLGVEDALPLGETVSRVLGVPVRVDNDLNAAALGAAHLLPEAGRDLAFLALGTGMAAGLVLDGRLRRGAHAGAGEIGHLTYRLDGLECACGQRGCLERYASGSAVDAAWPGTDGVPAPVALFAAADAGDPAALAVRAEFVGAVAAAVRVLVLTCDVATVVLGGGVAELGDPLHAAVVAELDRQARSSAFLASMDVAGRVRLAPRGVPVGAVGAALVGRGEE